jgi:hypothetical protein
MCALRFDESAQGQPNDYGATAMSFVASGAWYPLDCRRDSNMTRSTIRRG